jgi:3',5'-cyclic AMP phosphodiesterase CpdA
MNARAIIEAESPKQFIKRNAIKRPVIFQPGDHVLNTNNGSVGVVMFALDDGHWVRFGRSSYYVHTDQLRLVQ